MVKWWKTCGTQFSAICWRNYNLPNNDVKFSNLSPQQNIYLSFSAFVWKPFVPIKWKDAAYFLQRDHHRIIPKHLTTAKSTFNDDFVTAVAVVLKFLIYPVDNAALSFQYANLMWLKCIGQKFCVSNVLIRSWFRSWRFIALALHQIEANWGTVGCVWCMKGAEGHWVKIWHNLLCFNQWRIAPSRLKRTTQKPQLLCSLRWIANPKNVSFVMFLRC